MLHVSYSEEKLNEQEEGQSLETSCSKNDYCGIVEMNCRGICGMNFSGPESISSDTDWKLI